MPTRIFVVVLAAAALLGAGVGIVLAAHNASLENGDVPRAAATEPPHDAAPISAKIESQAKTLDGGKIEPAAAHAKETVPAHPGDIAHERTAKTPASTNPVSATTPRSAAAPSVPAKKGQTHTAPPSANVTSPSHASLDANENAAIATLRWLSSAEAILESSAVIDVDRDDRGEYGTIGEMAGVVPCREPAGVKATLLRPTILDASYAGITRAGNVLRNGYVFRVYLPGASIGRKVPGVGEAAGGARPDTNNCEVYWAAYAWPIEAGKTGQRAFFFNQEGDLFETANADGAYSGDDHAPAFDAAFSTQSPLDMSAPPPAAGAKANDGRVWSPARIAPEAERKR